MRTSLLRSVMLVALTALLPGCKDNTSYGSTNSKAACTEPQNPYSDGGGHDAGFNWARDTGGACNGNSDSFNEGCAEYHRQLAEYNGCVAKQK